MEKKYNNKRYTEEETRKKLMNYATAIGANQDLEQLFKKWDLIIPTLPPNERVEASRLAILELQGLLDIYADEGDGLTINGEVIIPPAKVKNPKMTW
jgi:hypothetical protein